MFFAHLRAVLGANQHTFLEEDRNQSNFGYA